MDSGLRPSGLRFALRLAGPGMTETIDAAPEANVTSRVFTSCTNAGPISVTVEDGRIVRVRPLAADEADFRPWTIEAGGQRYSPPKKFNVAPFVLAERDRVYAADRIRTPLK